jgi:hypothetical protein
MSAKCSLFNNKSHLVQIVNKGEPLLRKSGLVTGGVDLTDDVTGVPHAARAKSNALAMSLAVIAEGDHSPAGLRKAITRSWYLNG